MICWLTLSVNFCGRCVDAPSQVSDTSLPVKPELWATRCPVAAPKCKSKDRDHNNPVHSKTLLTTWCRAVVVKVQTIRTDHVSLQDTEIQGADMDWSRNYETPAKLIHTVMGHGVMPDANNVKFQRNYPSPSTHVRCALMFWVQALKVMDKWKPLGKKSERWCALIARAAQLCR